MHSQWNTRYDEALARGMCGYGFLQPETWSLCCPLAMMLAESPLC